nr:zinc finger SWIM domain-containing protein 7 isoform X2 [Odocoileus virginianus texanus]
MTIEYIVPDEHLLSLKFVFGSSAVQALDLVDHQSVTLISSPSGRRVYQPIAALIQNIVAQDPKRWSSLCLGHCGSHSRGKSGYRAWKLRENVHMSGFLPLLLVPGIRLLRAAEGGQPRVQAPLGSLPESGHEDLSAAECL